MKVRLGLEAEELAELYDFGLVLCRKIRSFDDVHSRIRYHDYSPVNPR